MFRIFEGNFELVFELVVMIWVPGAGGSGVGSAVSKLLLAACSVGVSLMSLLSRRSVGSQKRKDYIWKLQIDSIYILDSDLCSQDALWLWFIASTLGAVEMANRVSIVVKPAAS